MSLTLNFRQVAAVLFASTILALCEGVAVAEDSSLGERGFSINTSFQGNSSSYGQVNKFDTGFGYDFGRYFSVATGLPFYFVRSTTSFAPNGVGWNSGIGNAHLDLELTLYNPTLNFVSTLTGTAPTGDRDRGFSTGRATFDWNNHFNHAISKVTPFVNLGLANTVSDTHFFTRPFSSLGMVGHFDGGMSYRLSRRFSTGAGGYSIVPSGDQTIFSKVRGRQTEREPQGVDPPARSPGSGRGRRVFETTSTTEGAAAIARDNGVFLWLTLRPNDKVNVWVGYNRSVYYDLGTVFFGVETGVKNLLRR